MLVKRMHSAGIACLYTAWSWVPLLFCFLSKFWLGLLITGGWRLLLSTWALRINFHISNKCQLLIVQIVKTWPSYFYFGQKMNILCRQSRAAWCIGFSMIVSCDRLLIYSTFSVKISLSSFACVTVKNHPRYGCSRWFHVNINIAPKN